MHNIRTLIFETCILPLIIFEIWKQNRAALYSHRIKCTNNCQCNAPGKLDTLSVSFHPIAHQQNNPSNIQRRSHSWKRKVDCALNSSSFVDAKIQRGMSSKAVDRSERIYTEPASVGISFWDSSRRRTMQGRGRGGAAHASAAHLDNSRSAVILGGAGNRARERTWLYREK